jgi:hypothetical protein
MLRGKLVMSFSSVDRLITGDLEALEARASFTGFLRSATPFIPN